MELKEFLSRERNTEPEKYDFTDEEDCLKRQFSDEYRRLKGYEKFFAYKNEDMGYDPDISSSLLREIYEHLWEEEKLISCPCSDTMTGAAYAVKEYIGKKCSESIEKYKKKPGNKNRKVSVLLCETLYRDAAEYPEVRELLLGDKDLLDFVSCYHTIGNFIPVPEKFNANRSGNWADHDFWDLTLMQIKLYYDRKDKGTESEQKNIAALLPNCNSGDKETESGQEDIIDSLLTLLGIENILKNCVDWLKSYGNWEEFLYFNYLWDYIDTDMPGHHVKRFLPEHDWDHNEIPESNFGVFFRNVTDVIKKRGRFLVQMLELSDRIGEEAYFRIFNQVFRESEKKDWKNSQEIAEAVMRQAAEEGL